MAVPLLCEGLAGKAVTVGSWMFFTHQSCARSGSPRCAAEPGAPFGQSLNAFGAGACADAAAANSIAVIATMALGIMRASPLQETRRGAFPASRVRSANP